MISVFLLDCQTNSKNMTVKRFSRLTINERFNAKVAPNCNR